MKMAFHRTWSHLSRRCYCAISSNSAPSSTSGGMNKILVSTAVSAQTTFKQTVDSLWNTVTDIQLPKLTNSNNIKATPTPPTSVSTIPDTMIPMKADDIVTTAMIRNEDIINSGGVSVEPPSSAPSSSSLVALPPTNVDYHDLQRMMEECNIAVNEYHASLLLKTISSSNNPTSVAPSTGTDGNHVTDSSVLAKLAPGERMWDRVKSTAGHVIPGVSSNTPGVKDRVKTLPRYTTALSVDKKTRSLLQAVRRSSSNVVKIIRLDEFNKHIITHPDTRVTAVEEKAIQLLLWFRKTQYQDKILLANVNKSLALLGHVDSVKGSGIRILSIDGGGVRGLVALETLTALTKRYRQLTGENFLDSFDYIMGTSTGAIVNWMINFGNVPLHKCIPVYRELATKVFNGNMVLGAGRLVWKHAYYDTSAWVKAIKKFNGADKTLIDMTDPKLPKIAALSSLMNTPHPLSYVFRNYTHPVGTESRYPGHCRHKLWEALVASTAAPGYFEEVQIDDQLHQDGGVLTNNPTAVAIHEAKLLWPGVPIQCVVSLGTGLLVSQPEDVSSGTTPLKSKLLRILDSATDTEGIHSTLKDLLPANTYYRFNPVLLDYINIDECDPEKLDRMQVTTQTYTALNRPKVDSMIKQLALSKSRVQITKDKLNDIVSTFRK